MIVVDIETSGLYVERNGVWQIGAVDLDTGEDFLEEARIDNEDKAEEEALKIIGKTEKQLRDKNKQSQKELLEHFFAWVEKKKIKNMICEGPQFDFSFLAVKARKYGFKFPFHHRAFDLHSIAQIIYYIKKGKFLIDKEQSDMGLKNTLKFIGMKDERMHIDKEGVVETGKPHNALEDAKLTAECFSRLVYGKSLFSEYAKFKIPEELRQN